MTSWPRRKGKWCWYCGLPQFEPSNPHTGTNLIRVALYYDGRCLQTLNGLTPVQFHDLYHPHRRIDINGVRYRIERTTHGRWGRPDELPAGYGFIRIDLIKYRPR